MSIIYGGEQGGGYPVNYHSLNAVAGYLRHYENLLQLDFIAKNTADTREKIQALAEMKIAERKMAWWKNHPNYAHAQVLSGIERLKSLWAK